MLHGATMAATQTALSFLNAHREEIALGAGAFLASLLASMVVMTIVVIRLPEDYLERTENPPFLPGCPAWVRAAARVGKNVLGAVLVVLGVVLALPGVPGQGVLTMVIGVMLLDIPGKRRLEQRVLAAPKVHAAVNRVRARFRRPPLRHQAGSAGSSPGER
ncbi:hypothetical protein SOCEGT47_004100 [Sorangium cellulosum]|uniref:Transmembrane protein n=2 Tax=Sorangium cellulosum TaxID=56 RepID=A0A4P2PUA3_SORCE|nr:hypothetical protein SOCEGT47_004100 [Sorangium cellulosum]